VHKKYILNYMAKILLELDDRTAERLEEVAPSRSRQRSEFIRMAIRRALWDLEEEATAEAYQHQPDVEEPYFDAEVWERSNKPKRRKSKE